MNADEIADKIEKRAIAIRYVKPARKLFREYARGGGNPEVIFELLAEIVAVQAIIEFEALMRKRKAT